MDIGCIRIDLMREDFHTPGGIWTFVCGFRLAWSLHVADGSCELPSISWRATL